jgi:hypothetical protein
MKPWLTAAGSSQYDGTVAAAGAIALVLSGSMVLASGARWWLLGTIAGAIFLVIGADSLRCTSVITGTFEPLAGLEERVCKQRRSILAAPSGITSEPAGCALGAEGWSGGTRRCTCFALSILAGPPTPPPRSDRDGVAACYNRESTVVGGAG